jgi:hypothetical protein
MAVVVVIVDEMVGDMDISSVALVCVRIKRARICGGLSQ